MAKHDFYQVKFRRDGKTVYGIARPVYDFQPDTQEADEFEQGNLIVDDAIFPYYHTVAIDEVEAIPVEYGRYNQQTGDFEGADELQTAVSEEFKKAREKSDSIPEGQVQVGSMFAIGVADGRAYYVVTEIEGDRCAVEWRGFCPDRYTDHWFGYGGWYDLEKIKPYVRQAQAIHRLFGG